MEVAGDQGRQAVGFPSMQAPKAAAFRRVRGKVGATAQPKFLSAIKSQSQRVKGNFPMNAIIYLVGLIVVVLAILSFLGLS